MNKVLRHRPQSPYEHMLELHANGEAFYIELRSIFGMNREIPIVFDVLEYGPEWVLLRPVSRPDERKFWVRWADLGQFEVMVS